MRSRCSRSQPLPLKPFGEIVGRPIDLQNPPASVASACVRCMKDGSRVDPHIPPIREAFHHRAVGSYIRRGCGCDFSPQVRGEGNLQRRILPADAVQVNPDRDHPFKNGEWGFHMPLAELLRPGAIPRHVVTVRDANRPILMPTKRPIGSRPLVEEYSPHRASLRAKPLSNDFGDRRCGANHGYWQYPIVKPGPGSRRLYRSKRYIAIR